MDLRSSALSALGWWREAGVDALVDDAPRDWLKPATTPSPSTSAAPPPAAVPMLPATLAAMHAKLAEPGLVANALGRPLAPAGDVAAGLMLLVDAPESGDDEAGQLVAGEAGRLLDRMLGAIGRDRASIYLAALAPARPAGGRIAPADAGELAELALQHVALVRPRVLLLLGDAAAAAILGMNLAEARGRIHEIEHRGASVAAIASFHPRYLLREQGAKAQAWQDLRLLLGRLAG